MLSLTSIFYFLELVFQFNLVKFGHGGRFSLIELPLYYFFFFSNSYQVTVINSTYDIRSCVKYTKICQNTIDQIQSDFDRQGAWTPSKKIQAI